MTNEWNDPNGVTFGPSRHFRPVCIRYPHGFYGGPAGYKEVSEMEKDAGPLIVEAVPLHEPEYHLK